MDKKILIILLFLTFCSAKSQENFREFKYYDIYEDYVSNKPIEPIVNTEIKELNSEYIKIGKKFDKITNKKSKIENSAWALEYQNNLYFNTQFPNHFHQFIFPPSSNFKFYTCGQFNENAFRFYEFF